MSFNLFGQTNSDIENKLIQHFKTYNWNDSVVTRNSLYKTDFKDNNFNVSISDELLDFETEQIVIKNPYFSEKFDESEKKEIYTKNFPKSFSVIYQDNLIVLFENGKFGCFDLNSLERNVAFEEQLNTKRFNYHWIVDNRLVAQSGRKKLFWDGAKWVKFKEKFPLKNQPKLFDDDEFIVYSDCFGEWGGTVYFYEKATGKTYFTESTCANTVTKTDDGYQVLANLGHMFGSSEIKVIPNPRKLTQAKSRKINKTIDGEALGYTDKSNAFTKKIGLYGIEFFSKFTLDQEEFFIANVLDLTFVAKIENNEIKIVHPLFFNNLYGNDPITTQYGEYTLVNLGLFVEEPYKEASVLIIHKNKITKIDWNEKHI